MEKEKNKFRAIVNIAAYSLLLLMMSCKASFEPIDYGRDACAHCKMTIIDKRFAAEMLTGKGRAYKFDDIHCLKQYVADNNINDDKATFYIAPYGGESDKFLDATKAFYLQGSEFKSPMNGNYAAFALETEAKQLGSGLQVVTWENVK
jgi:copper chaperone NosL